MGLASAWRVFPHQCTSCMGNSGESVVPAPCKGEASTLRQIYQVEGCSVPKPVDISLVQVVPSTLAQGSFQEVLSGTLHSVLECQTPGVWRWHPRAVKWRASPGPTGLQAELRQFFPLS